MTEEDGRQISNRVEILENRLRELEMIVAELRKDAFGSKPMPFRTYYND